MACLHKFLEYLNLEGIENFQPTTLIVGTFNPSWPDGNPAEWFYGRTHNEHGNQNNNFWEVLPRLYHEDSLINAGPNEWKQFCAEKQIAITDLISCIEDADEHNLEHINCLRGYSDNKIANRFQQHVFVGIVQILIDHPSIQNVYLTRGIGETFWRRHWRPVRNYALVHNLHIHELLTPSGYAFYQHGKYNKNNPYNQIQNLPDFILFRWRQEWHLI